jgi:hypothetical protein
MELEFPADGAEPASRVIIRQPGRELAASRLDDAAAKRLQDTAAVLEKRIQDRTPAPGSLQALRTLLTSLQAGTVDDSLMSPGAPIHQQLDELRKNTAGFGAIQSIAFTGVGPAGPDIYRVDTDKGAWMCRIWLSPEGKIDQAMISPVR